MTPIATRWVLAAAFSVLTTTAAHAREATLSTIPRHVYKVPDAIDAKEKSELWYFHVVVADSIRPLRLHSATIHLFSGDHLHKTIELDAEALTSARGVNFRTRAGIKEWFDLRHHFREPSTLAIDRVRYRLELRDSLGHPVQSSIDIPIRTYRQKTKLIFPIRGNFIVTNGTVVEGGHHEWSQSFAYDIVGLGEKLEWLLRGDGAENEQYAGWAREVLAPAAGVVTYSRNDVPDNPAPGEMIMEKILSLPEPNWSVAGNVIVIDHGGGEYSCFGHMQQGAVRVKRGDRVKQGQVVGLLGNSGHSQGPHLHYQLMNGKLLFKSDPLPSRSENVEGGAPVQGYPSAAKARK